MPRLGQRKEKSGERVCDRMGIGIVARYISDSSINKAIASSGAKEQRRRDLPSDLVVRFTLALNLFPNDGYQDVLKNLLPPGEHQTTVPSTAAITKARDRVGPEPFRTLFDNTTRRIAVSGKTPNAFYKNWRLCSFDGSTFDVPDTAENVTAFGKPGAAQGQSAFPQVRVVSLVETATHSTFAAAFGGIRHTKGQSEKSLLVELIPAMQEGDLYLADRNFFGFDTWKMCADTGASLCWRIKEGVLTKPVRTLEDGSYIATLSNPESKKDTIEVRIIEYQVDGSDETYRLATTIADAALAPAAELAQLYPHRWENEGYYDEIKNHLHDKRPVLRSGSPERIEQEMWAMLIVHNAIRNVMHAAALAGESDQQRLSFTTTVKIVRRETTRRSSFSP